MMRKSIKYVNLLCTFACALLNAHQCTVLYPACKHRQEWELSKGPSWRHTALVKVTEACCGSWAGPCSFLTHQKRGNLNARQIEKWYVNSQYACIPITNCFGIMLQACACCRLPVFCHCGDLCYADRGGNLCPHFLAAGAGLRRVWPVCAMPPSDKQHCRLIRPTKRPSGSLPFCLCCPAAFFQKQPNGCLPTC